MTPTDPGGSADAGRDQVLDAQAAFRWPVAALALTAGVAGFLDAFALLHYGVFVANQSGNVVQLGMGLAGSFPAWPASGTAIVGCGVGVVLGVRLRGGRGATGTRVPLRQLAVTATILSAWTVLDLVLGSGATLAQQVVLTFISSAALGVLAMLIVRIAGIPTSTTYQSGTVVKTATAISEWLANHTSGTTRPRRTVRFGLAGLTGYAAGGGLGALAQRHVLWTYLATMAALAILILLTRARRPPARPPQ